MNVEWERIADSKRALRKRLAALPFEEKLRMLDVLRERLLAIRAARIRPLADGKKPSRG
jgi:hypothetical protein